MGPIVCAGLRKEYPDRVGCQGVGGPYTAGLLDNVSAKGTTAAAIAEAQRMFNLANTKCPKAVIAFGGYRYSRVRIFHHDKIRAYNHIAKAPL
jgi:cutinase